MTTIYLIRHAQAEGNLYRRCQAWYDGGITPVGCQQIEALKHRFIHTHFDAVYSSDLQRTMATAAAIYRVHDLPLQLEPDLREIRSGCWEDRTWGELLKTERENLLAFWRCDPSWKVSGSETFPEIQARFDRAIKRIADTHDGKTVAIFAHGCIIRSALALWHGLPADRIRDIPHGDNTSVAKIEYEGGQIRVVYYNDISHLPDALAHAPHPAAESDETTALKIQSSSLYFVPMDLPHAKDSYWAARKDAWIASHGTSAGFEGEKFLCDALTCYEYDSESILTVMLGDHPVGILQMDFDVKAHSNTGRVPFVYLKPEFRGRGLGVQIIGQVVSSYRKLGCRRVWLRCAPENKKAQEFYTRQGFYKVADEPYALGTLDILEKEIHFVGNKNMQAR